MLSVFLVSVLTDISWLWYNVVGAVSVVLIGAILSRLAPPREAPAST